MADFDPKVIQKFADRLYSQARSILISYSLVLGFLGAGVLYGLELTARIHLNPLLGFIVGALIGYLMAIEKAFKLKLEAQVALCQVKIEENTRK